MKLQRIIAKDSRSATEQAIAQYGRDVLVVSNSRVNGMTELIVAVDVEPERMPAPQVKPGAGQMFESALQTHLSSPPNGARAGGSSEWAGQGNAATHNPGNAPLNAPLNAPGTAPGTASTTSPSHHPGPATASLTSAPATSANPSRDHGTGTPGGFVPAHLALMQSAQRAAAVIESAQAASAASQPIAAAGLGSPRTPAAPNAGRAPEVPTRHPVLRYGHHFALPHMPMQTMGSFSLSITARASNLVAPASPVEAIGDTPAQAAAPTDALGTHSTDSASAADTPIATPADARAAVDLIRQEIAQLRKEMRMGQQLQSWAAQGPAHRWNEALNEVGVSTTLRALLISGLSNDYDDHQALAAIEAQMLENLPAAPRTTGARNSATRAPWRSGAHLLSGPAGSGKTSMAARLAQEASERLGVDRVVLVSWNDARPGAWGQLQLWASRIGVQAFRAADTATLELLLQEHRGQLVIIDSGLSQPDILSAACAGLDVLHHLVMPADATSAALRRWMGEQAPAWQDLMVTRLDESAQPWPLLQVCCERGLAPVAASDGSGLQHLRLPYDGRALLQHGMGLLTAGLAGGTLSEGPAAPRAAIEIPTIEQITTTIPPREAGRSGRSTRATSTRTGRSTATARTGAPHA